MPLIHISLHLCPLIYFSLFGIILELEPFDLESGCKYYDSFIGQLAQQISKF